MHVKQLKSNPYGMAYMPSRKAILVGHSIDLVNFCFRSDIILRMILFIEWDGGKFFRYLTNLGGVTLFNVVEHKAFCMVCLSK